MIARYLKKDYRVMLETDDGVSIALLHIDDFADLFGTGSEQIIKEEGIVKIECQIVP